MVAGENTTEIHNLVVCTLCSCYPWPVLGLPPIWYKSSAYRSRAVIDPRGVIAEFGTELPDDIEVRVWDSTAEVRYLVLPARPDGTEGLGEERSEEHTSELQSLMRISYDVFCLKKKKIHRHSAVSFSTTQTNNKKSVI